MTFVEHLHPEERVPEFPASPVISQDEHWKRLQRSIDPELTSGRTVQEIRDQRIEQMRETYGAELVDIALAASRLDRTPANQADLPILVGKVPHCVSLTRDEVYERYAAEIKSALERWGEEGNKMLTSFLKDRYVVTRR